MKYVVTGVVHPERANVNISHPPMHPSTGGEIAIRCEASQLTIVLTDQPVDGYIAAFILAEHLAQAVISALGFSLATGYVVEIVQVISRFEWLSPTMSMPCAIPTDVHHYVFVRLKPLSQDLAQAKTANSGIECMPHLARQETLSTPTSRHLQMPSAMEIGPI